MSARRKARKRALDFLYEADIRGATALGLFGERPADELSQGDYVRELLVGVEEHLSKIDELATELSTDDSAKYINGVLGRIVILKPSFAI